MKDLTLTLASTGANCTELAAHVFLHRRYWDALVGQLGVMPPMMTSLGGERHELWWSASLSQRTSPRLTMGERGVQPASHRQMSITRILSADREELVKSD